jgi:hypothetical protein
LPNYENPIAGLFYALQEDSPLKKGSPEIGSEEIRIGHITIALG